MKRLIGSLLLSCLIVVGWAQTLPMLIKSGDRIKIACPEVEKLSGSYTVSKDGFVVLPMVGAQQVSGLTEHMAGAKIASELLRLRIVSKASVKLRLEGSKTQWINVSGHVRRAGELPFREGMRLADVIAAVQPSIDADLRKVVIEPEVGSKSTVDYTKYDGKSNANNPAIKPGDHVQFGSKPVEPPSNPPVVKPETDKPKPDQPAKVSGEVQVFGAVLKPGMIAWSEGMTVEDAITKAGGLSERADPAEGLLVRGSKQAALKMDSVLKIGDIVRVPARAASPAQPPRNVERVRVEGGVNKPGRIEATSSLTASEALRKAGGLKRTAEPSKARILRPSGSKNLVIAVDLAKVAMGAARDPLLLPNDVLSIPERAVGKGLNKTAKIALGAAGLLLLFGMLR